MRLCRAAAQRYLPTRRLGRLRCPPLDDPWSRRGLPRKSGGRRRSASSAEANSEWWSSQWLLLKRGSLRGSKSISWLVRFELQRRPQHPLARNGKVASLHATKQPDGQIKQILSSPSRKNIPLNPSGKSGLPTRPSHPTRGAARDRHERAVGCGGRGGLRRRARLIADGEVVWSWRPGAGAKFCESHRGVTVARKPVTGESAK